MSKIKDNKRQDTRDQKARPWSTKSRVVFVLNRLLIVLAVAAILGGLFSDQWRIVLRNAILL
jgi:hypothetical protein